MKFDSEYSPNKQVTAAQYIAELICKKRADSTNTVLPIFFWRLDEWKNYYLYQLMQANILIKRYDPITIIQAINDKKAKTVFSLKNPYLIKIIEIYERKKGR